MAEKTEVPKKEKKVTRAKEFTLDEKDESHKALKQAIDRINKELGSHTVSFLGEKPSMNVEVTSSGSLKLDQALGVGGYPNGRIIEIYGPESSGKTTLTLHAIAETQKQGKVAAFIDAEHALDPVYAKNLGVNVDALLISQPNSGENALFIAETLASSGAVGLIVVDSVAALTPQVEIDGEIGDAHVGIQARLMSQAMRKLTPILSKTKTTMMFTNQIRDKIGVMGYGDPTTTPGGRALKFYSSVRIDVRRIGSLKHGENAIGNEVKFKVTKNKVAPPFKEVVTEIVFGKGISVVGEVIDLAILADIIEKSGAWFSYKSERLGQGRENVRKLLLENKELYDNIVREIKEKDIEIEMEEDEEASEDGIGSTAE